MNQFEKFKEKFNSIYITESLRDKISDFINDFSSKRNPLNGELKENLDENEADSYDTEKGTLGRIFFFPEFDIFVGFFGKTNSYDGDVWDEMKEVKPKVLNTTIYE